MYSTFQPKNQVCEDGLLSYKLNRVIEYINTYLDQDLKIAEIAKEVGLSQYYFARLFKQSMGIAPHRYLIQQRIERAKQLLKQQELPIAEVALQCGFANQSHLTRHFRQLTGVTPKVYREHQHTLPEGRSTTGTRIHSVSIVDC